MFLRWHMHSIVRDFKRVKRKYRQTKGNPLKSHAQQALNAIRKSSLPFNGRANDGNKACRDFFEVAKVYDRLPIQTRNAVRNNG